VVDNPTSIFDGEGRYASRTRANREVVVFTTADLRSDASNNTASKTITVNGKVTSMIIDPSRVKSTSTTATSGSIEFRMDIEDSGGNGYLCFDQIAALDYRTASNTPLRFEVSPGANQGTSASHFGNPFAVNAPASSTAGGDTIGQPTPWNGLLCGTTTITVADGSGTFDADTGELRVIIVYE